MKKKKTFKAKADALLSLQFYKNKDRTMCFLITSNLTKENEFSNLATSIDLSIFAKDFAENEMLDRAEKLAICEMFIKAKKDMEKIEEDRKLYNVKIYQNGMVQCFDRNKNQIPELQGEWDHKKMQILEQDKGGVFYFFGTFNGHNTVIDKDTAMRLWITVVK